MKFVVYRVKAYRMNSEGVFSGRLPLNNQNQYKARELLRNDEDAKRALTRLREKISLEEERWSQC